MTIRTIRRGALVMTRTLSRSGFSGETERGTRFTDGVLLMLGDKSEDGSVYYAKNETTFIRQPVLGLPAEWVETFVNLAKDPPYGEAEESGG